MILARFLPQFMIIQVMVFAENTFYLILSKSLFIQFFRTHNKLLFVFHALNKEKLNKIELNVKEKK